MKKLLVILFSALMILSFSMISMAAVSIKGDTTFVRDFSVDDPDGNVDQNKLELNLFFSNNISETVDWTLRFYASNNTYQKSDGSETGLVGPWIREAYSNIKSDWGKLRFGLFEIKTYNSIGILADNSDSVYGRIKEPFALGYTSPEITPGLTAGLVYLLDGEKSMWDNRVKVNDGAYVATLAYKNGIIYTDLNLINTAVDGDKDGYVLNVKVTPIEMLTIGLNMGENNQEKEVQILELQYKKDTFYAKYGMDLNDDAETNLKGQEFTRIAYCIGYVLKNGITLEYRSKDLDETKDSTQELRVIYKW
ncbi:MAG: hypothetical protein GXY86_15005 [Firmicutes bacterium]|nr:hypothetical protein [Bacillota bacterium]